MKRGFAIFTAAYIAVLLATYWAFASGVAGTLTLIFKGLLQ